MKRLLIVFIILLTGVLLLSSLVLNLEGELSTKSQSFGLVIIGRPFGTEILELGVGGKLHLTTSETNGLFLAPNLKIGFDIPAGDFSLSLGIKYEPLIVFTPFTFINRFGLEFGLLQPFRILARVGIALYDEVRPYVGLTIGFSTPFGINGEEKTIKLQEYGINPFELSKLIFSTDRLQEIRCGEKSQTANLNVQDLSVLANLFSKNAKIKLYVGFSEDWDIEKNGYVEFLLEKKDTVSLNINGSQLKKLPTEVLRSAQQKLYIIGYEINKLVTEDFKRPLRIMNSDLRLRILPGKEVTLLRGKTENVKELLSSRIYADRYIFKELLVRDVFGNEYKLFGNFELNLTKAGRDIQNDNLVGTYEYTNSPIDVKLKVDEVIPNTEKIGLFRANFDKNTAIIEEIFTLNITSLRDVYGNDIPWRTIKSLSEKSNIDWKFEIGKVKFNGQEIFTKQIGKGRNWSVEIELADGKISKFDFQDELIVMPNLKKVNVQISENEFNVLSNLIADENGKITFKSEPIKLKDNFGNEIEIRSLNFSGNIGWLTIDLSNFILNYKLTKAQLISERDFNTKKIVVYVPKINTEQTIDAALFGSLTFKATVKPNLPVRIVFDTPIDSAVFPTYFDESTKVSKEYKYRIFDKYGNEALESDLKFVSQSSELEKVFTASSGKIKLSNENVRKVGTFTVSIQNSNGIELEKLNVKILPVLRSIELESGTKIESLGYNVYKMKLRAHDGNGNPYTGKQEIIINDSIKKTIDFVNGISEVEFSSNTWGLGSVKTIVEPSISEINYREKQRVILINESFISLGKINPSTLTYERQINDEKARENAYGPAVSLTGNYVSYFVVKQDGTPGLIIKDLRDGKQEDILSQVSFSKRRSGQSSSELKQETVYSYTWVPMRDILIYTPMVSNSFDIYAYIPELNQRKELFRNGKNNTDVTFDYLGKIVTWVSGGTVMIADVDYSNGISFKNIKELIKLNQQVAIQPSISPNGRYVAFIADTDIYLYDINAKKQFKLTNDLSSEFEIAWSPDSKYIAYYKKVGSSYALYLTDISNIEIGKGFKEYQIYKDIAYDFGKPSWISAEEVVFAANDVSVSAESLTVFDISLGKTKKIKVIQDLGAAYTFFSILPVEKNGNYTLKAVYGGFSGRESVFLGQIK